MFLFNNTLRNESDCFSLLPSFFHHFYFYISVSLLSPFTLFLYLYLLPHKCSERWSCPEIKVEEGVREVLPWRPTLPLGISSLPSGSFGISRFLSALEVFFGLACSPLSSWPWVAGWQSGRVGSLIPVTVWVVMLGRSLLLSLRF